MKTKLIIFFALALLFLSSSHVDAFEIIGKKESYVGPRYLTLGFSQGFSGIKGYDGVGYGGLGWAFELSMGHEYSESFWFDFTYKLSFAPITTPNPTDTTQSIDSTFLFHSTIWRLYYRYSVYNIQPYVYLGVGFYSFDSVDSKTGMDLPLNFQIPVGTGIMTHLYKNKLTFMAGLDWHILFGENQDPAVLALLGVNKVSFDVWSVVLKVTWHIF